MAGIQVACERIATTPLPFPHTLLMQRTAYLFCLLLPFGLVASSRSACWKRPGRRSCPSRCRRLTTCCGERGRPLPREGCGPGQQASEQDRIVHPFESPCPARAESGQPSCLAESGITRLRLWTGLVTAEPNDGMAEFVPWRPCDHRPALADASRRGRGAMGGGEGCSPRPCSAHSILASG
jgi:Bestrophin, RFP-TM, chloride channel